MNNETLATLIRAALLAIGGASLARIFGKEGSENLVDWAVTGLLLFGPVVWSLAVKKIAQTRNANVQAALNAVSEAVAAVTPLVKQDGRIGPLTEKAALTIANAAIAQLASSVNPRPPSP